MSEQNKKIGDPYAYPEQEKESEQRMIELIKYNALNLSVLL